MQDGPFKADIVTKTAAEWTAANPLLPKGDLGIESDTGVMKAGNGAAWTATSAIPGTGNGANGTFVIEDANFTHTIVITNGKIVSWTTV